MKKAIVVGATSGLGEGIARKLANEGYRVGITGRRKELLEKLKAENPSHFFIRTFNVIDTKDTIASMQALIDELGGLDLMVLSSGIGFLNEELDFDFEERLIQVNVTGFTNLINWTYQFFESQNSGHLVAISSIAGLRGSARAAAYHASKAYQSNYIEGLQQRVEKRKQNITITNIRPGFVKTALLDGGDFFWAMPVDRAVYQICNAIRKKKKEVFVTRRWKFAAFAMKITPSFIYNKMNFT